MHADDHVHQKYMAFNLEYPPQSSMRSLLTWKHISGGGHISSEMDHSAPLQNDLSRLFQLIANYWQNILGNNRRLIWSNDLTDQPEYESHEEFSKTRGRMVEEDTGFFFLRLFNLFSCLTLFSATNSAQKWTQNTKQTMRRTEVNINCIKNQFS